MDNKEFKIWQEIFVVKQWWIVKHILRWFFEIEWQLNYLAISFWQSVTINKEHVFHTLEEAKEKAIKMNKETIEAIEKTIETIEKAKEEDIDMVLEKMPTPQELQKNKEDSIEEAKKQAEFTKEQKETNEK